MHLVLTGFILPFIFLVLIIFALAYKVYRGGGPTLLVLCFMIITLGPNLIYALVRDESSGILFLCSLMLAFLVTGGLRLYMHRKRHL